MPTTDTTDAALVARVLEGDVEAFTTLVDRHHDACARYAMRMLGNVQDTEDALQETFLRAYRALRRYREQDRFAGWLYRILVNQCRSLAKRRGRLDSRFVLAETGDPEPGDPRADGTADLGDTLQVALANLPPLLREALLLKYGEGLEYEDMARVTGSSVSALKMRVKRARDAVRPRLEELLNG